jgi:hypothetical protein
MSISLRRPGSALPPGFCETSVLGCKTSVPAGEVADSGLDLGFFGELQATNIVIMRRTDIFFIDKQFIVGNLLNRTE